MSTSHTSDLPSSDPLIQDKSLNTERHVGGFAIETFGSDGSLDQSGFQLRQQSLTAGDSAPIRDTVGSFEGVHFKIDHRDSNTLLSLSLQPGCEIKAKPGAMVAMSASVQIKGTLNFSAKKMLLGGGMTESTFTGPGEVLLAPEIWGDILPIHLDGQKEWNLSKDGFLASTAGVVKTQATQKLGKAMFSGEGLVIKKASGVGILWVKSLGAIVKKTLGDGEEWIIDNGHLVAWTASYTVERIDAGGFWSSAHTDEGMVCRFIGPGLVYIQTRNPDSLSSWIRSQSSGY
ncbi:hypothetical protein FRC02_011590 [Tulasnella sp. 418]|nr:hypothetical protein FRC02_011590 [Tulasnella sp. 418]